MTRASAWTYLFAAMLVACEGADDVTENTGDASSETSPGGGASGGPGGGSDASASANADSGTNRSDGGGGGTTGGRMDGGSQGGGAEAGSMQGGTQGGGTDAGPGASTGGTQGLPMGTLGERIGVTPVTLPAGIKPGVRNWRIWAQTMLKVSPVFTVPMADCGTLLGVTTGAAATPNARVVRLDANDKALATYDLGAMLELRGLAAEPDGHFAALLWNGTTDQIWVKRYDLMGKELFATELTNKKNGVIDNSPTDFGIGESRLEYGEGEYGAYYHVHSVSGHEGDTLKYVNASSGAERTTWAWGCSHSMSNLLTFHPTSKIFLASCVTDCYPGTSGADFATTAKGGIYTENKNKVIDVAAGCNGSVAGELGGAAPASSGWKLVFNAHQQPTVLGQKSYSTMTMNQDIGFAAVGPNKLRTGNVVWLTTTPSINEADSALVRFTPMGDTAEQYIVGWQENGVYKLARVDAAGAFMEQPSDVTAKAKWGQRDDPFRAHVNGDIVWAWADAANATTLKLARLRSGATAQCATF